MKMIKVSKLLVSVFLVAVFFTSWYNECALADEPGDAVGKDAEMVAKGNNEFALELYKELKGSKGNLFLSPYSISTALAMTYAGAEGETASQMARTLHFSLDDARLHPAFKELIDRLNADKKDRGYELTTANALWGQKGYEFLQSFLDITNGYYGAGLRIVDYENATEEARLTINAWVEEKTKEKIKELIKEGMLTGETRLVLTNAIYFKGDWASRFDEKETKEEPFTLSSGEGIKVPLMSQKRGFKYAENDDVQVLEMPYVKDELSMIAFLPKDKKRIKAVEDLFLKKFDDWTSMLHTRETVVFFPKFKVESEFTLKDVLISMGMKNAFSHDFADFSKMTDFSKMPPDERLFISKVIHKAYVDVNEKGTEAAAATAVVMARTTSAMPEPEPVIFRADHPFIFAIRDNRTGSILFIGRVEDPR